MKQILYDWGGANLWIFHRVNDVRGEFYDRLMQLGSFLGDHGLVSVYLALAILAGMWQTARAPMPERQRLETALRWFNALAVLGVAYSIDGALAHWIKLTLDFPRPAAALPPDTLHVIGVPEYRYSFPSGHSVFAATVAASLWPVLNRYWKVGLAGYLLWVGVSRVSLGMHFPADVLGGILLALLTVWLVRRAVSRIVRLPAAARDSGDTDA